MATTISREYIYPHLLDDERTTSSDMAENHRHEVSHMHYTCSANDIPTLSTEVICEMWAACHRWHDILGIGKNPPPIPLRLLSAALQTLSTSLEFKAMIDGAMEEALARHIASASTSPAGPLGHPRPSTHPHQSPPLSLQDPYIYAIWTRWGSPGPMGLDQMGWSRSHGFGPALPGLHSYGFQ